MVRNLKQVLKDLGWADGFNIPVANEENQNLEAEVEALILSKAEIIIQCESANERINGLKSVLKKVIKEKQVNQQLLNRLRNNLDSEMAKMEKIEIENKTNDLEMKDLKGGILKSDEDSKKLQEEIIFFTGKVTELKDFLNWGEDTLFAWEEDLSKTERDFDFINYYKIMDQNKYNELEHKRQVAQLELIEINEIEKRESDKLVCLENHFYQICRDFKRIETERDSLMQIWQNVNETIRNRDAEIEKVYKKIDFLKDLIRHKLIEYVAAEKSYEASKCRNDYYETHIIRFEKERPSIEQQLEASMKVLENVHKEILATEQQIRQLESEYNVEIQKNTNLENSMKVQLTKIRQLIDQNEKLKDKIDTANLEKMTSEQKCKTAQEVYEMGQKMLNEELREIARVNVLTQKLNDEWMVLKDKKFLAERELSDTIRHEKEIDEDIILSKQQLLEVELTEHNVQAEMVDIIHTLATLEGRTLDIDLQNKLKEQAAELQEELGSKTKDVIRLKNEIRTLNKELNIIQLDINQIQKETDQLNTKISECKCSINGGKRAYGQIQEQYNRCTLKLNLMKMQISFAEENKKKEGLSVSMLERQKLYLASAMQERFVEIQGQKEVLIVHKKTLNEEKSFLKRSMDHLHARIKIMEKRYEVALDTLCKSDDGERISISSFQIKTAQEKNELQDLGDELEARINKTEKEILAMENTLRVVSSTNENFKTNLEALDLDSAEVIELNKLDKVFLNIAKDNKKLKHTIQDLASTIEVIEKNIKRLQQYGIDAQQEWKQKEKEVLSLTKDLASKQIKLERATKILQKVSKEVRMKEPSQYKTLALRDIEVRIEGERNKCVLQQLAELAAIYIETSPIVNKYLTEKGLTLPPLQDSVYSIRTSTPERRSSDAGSRLSALSEISLSPSIVQLDPTVLLPEPYQRATCRKY